MALFFSIFDIWKGNFLGFFWQIIRKLKRLKKLFFLAEKSGLGSLWGYVYSKANQTRRTRFFDFFYWFWLCITFFQTFLFVFQVKSHRWKLATQFKYFGFRIKLSISWMVQNYCHIPAYIFFFFWLQIENIFFYLFSIPLWKIKFLKMRLFHRKNGKIVHNSKHAKIIVRRTRYVKNFASFTQVLAFF